jgi:GMP synthase (glutamine-hydrolysing)
MKNEELILIIDFYGQYNQLIARRVRECNVYSEIVPFNTSIEKIKEKNPKGIIFTGGPASVYGENSPKCDPEIFNLGIPVLGICYGMQLMTHMLGGEVQRADKREYGVTSVKINNSSKLFEGFGESNDCLMSHTDFVAKLPEGFENIGYTEHCPNAAMQNTKKNFYGIQFHPEVNHTNNGTEILKNFVYNVCGCTGKWKMNSFVEETIQALKEKIGDKKALCALSGGVDSSVAAALVNKAIGKNLTCIFVDHGLLRKNEAEEVEEVFTKNFDVNFIKVDAKDRFLGKLAGIDDPEQKRKIIGEEFIRVFEEEAKKIGTVDYLVQGTIYPDVIESGVGVGAKIKSHHNVGGLPDYVDFKEIVEPLRDLFKDEVRKAGLELGLPEFLVYRQPFPGPGLAIRVIGDITEDKLTILKDADYIFREEIANAGLDRTINQYFAVLTNLKSVGVMGDERTYDYTVALRAVTTSDFMTAEWSKIPYEILEKVSSRIVNEVKHVNRVVYDITGKPPATIEWE